MKTMYCEYAILTAIELIERSGVADHDKSAAQCITALESILIQKGCEHFDSAVKDGKLTHLMDVIIHG